MNAHVDVIMKTMQSQAACLYVGEVMHARLKPFTHRFQYNVFNLLIDLDRLDEADQQSRLFRINRKGLVSFYESDHGDETKNGLSGFIRHTLKETEPTLEPDKIQLLCYPRVAGYVFNPISIYYCFKNDDIIAMVYEVRNTFGGKHIYVSPVHKNHKTRAGLRQKCAKTLHVSPFIEMNMEYAFRVSEPAEALRFRILESNETGPLLSATLKANRFPLNSRNLLIQLIRKPFLTAKVMAGIHYEALKLWLKGAKFIPNPHKKLDSNNIP